MAENEQMNARRRAARRSTKRNQGVALINIDAEDEAPVPTEDAATPTEETPPTETEATAAEAPAEEGGLVAEAEQEAQTAEAVEETAEGGEGSPAEEMAEGEMPTEEAAAPAEEPATEEATAEEAIAEEAAPEEATAPEAAAPEAEESFEYKAPEGASHDDLIDQYHEAISYGDLEQAKALYKQLQNHRYLENGHRTKVEGHIQKEMDEYVATAKELEAKHPELGQAGIEVDKVMAIAAIYRENGMKPAAALRQAVADLFPEPMAPAVPEAPVMAPEAAVEAPELPVSEEPQAETTEEAPEAAAPEAEEPVAEAPAEEPAAEAAPESPIPDMSARMERKARLSVVPTASARNEPPKAEEPESRSKAIERYKKARGQM